MFYTGNDKGPDSRCLKKVENVKVCMKWLKFESLLGIWCQYVRERESGEMDTDL